MLHSSTAVPMKRQPSAENRFKEKTNDAEMGSTQRGTEENGRVSLAGLCGFATGLLLVINTTGHAKISIRVALETLMDTLCMLPRQ